MTDLILRYLFILLDMCSAIVVSNSYVFEILVDNFHWIWLSKISWIFDRPFWRIKVHLVGWLCLVDLWYCFNTVWSCLSSWSVLILTARLSSFWPKFFFFWWCWLEPLVLRVYQLISITLILFFNVAKFKLLIFTWMSVLIISLWSISLVRCHFLVIDVLSLWIV